MNKQTRSKAEKKLAQLRALKILRYSDQNKKGAKRDRFMERIAARVGRVRVRKPARRDHDEIVARQNKFRAPYGSEE